MAVRMRTVALSSSQPQKGTRCVRRKSPMDPAASNGEMHSMAKMPCAVPGCRTSYCWNQLPTAVEPATAAKDQRKACILKEGHKPREGIADSGKVSTVYTFARKRRASTGEWVNYARTV